MFQTHRSAIFPLQNDSNIILWNWVELAVDVPFFMLEIESKAEEGDFVTRRMTSNINVLRGYATPSDSDVLKRVFLLSPGFVNGSDTFQLDAVESVCLSPKNSINMLFRLTDGRTLHFSLGEDRLDDSHYTEVIFKQPT